MVAVAVAVTVAVGRAVGVEVAVAVGVAVGVAVAVAVGVAVAVEGLRELAPASFRLKERNEAACIKNRNRGIFVSFVAFCKDPSWA